MTIKIKNGNKKCLVFISGLQDSVNVCKEHIEESISSDSLNLTLKKYKLTED